MKTYYIIMQRGVPVDVAKYEFNARALVEQLSTKDNPATIVPVTPIQLELPFDDTIQRVESHSCGTRCKTCNGGGYGH